MRDKIKPRYNSSLDSFVKHKVDEQMNKFIEKINRHKWIVSEYERQRDIGEEERKNKIMEHIDAIEEIYKTVNDEDYWNHFKSKVSYEYRKTQPHKDNDFRNESLKYLIHSPSKMRTPKLKRKSAWKRFYKLFPELKGQDEFHGKKLKKE